jgi:hypothetical protein
MSDVVIKGNASGTGSVTIESPNTNSNFTLTLPTETGTVLTNNGNQAGTFSSLTVNSNNISADNSLGFRNRIINGDMRIAQRGTAAVTASGNYPVDRFIMGNSTDGAFSAQQDSSAPAGFVNSVKITTTTADGTLTTDQQLNFRQAIEGTNVSDLAWGTANAKTVTLSFWVRSSLTGTFGGSLKNGDNDRSYPFEYTISAVDTWEYKTVTIPGDTTGTWLTNNGRSITLHFGLGSGPDRSGPANAWAGANYTQPTSTVSVIGTLNATWYVTGVQLEVGSVATPFERRPFGTELALCQRYYFRDYAGTNGYFAGSGLCASTTVADFTIIFPVTMRASPSALEQSGTAGDYRVVTSANTTCSSVPIFLAAYARASNIRFTVSSGLTLGQGAFPGAVNANAYLGWSAEL